MVATNQAGMVQYSNKLIRDAFHGTSKANAESIIQSRRFIYSRGEDCYLGDGVYFFESGLEHAKWWAEKKFSGQQIGIIIAHIQLGKCLELGNPQCIELIRLAKAQIETARFSERITDAFVINFITAIIDRQIETVRGYFPVKATGKIFPGSHIYANVRVTICVKKYDNILHYNILEGA